jgi:hypothetical protein
VSLNELWCIKVILKLLVLTLFKHVFRKNSSFEKALKDHLLWTSISYTIT